MSHPRFLTLGLLLLGLVLTGSIAAEDDPAPNRLDFPHVAMTRSVVSAEISPDGSRVAYVLSVPRRPGEDPDGSAWRELHVGSIDGTGARAYVAGEVRVGAVRFTPDGRYVTYLSKRGDDEHTALYAIHVDGGESAKLLEFETNIAEYRIAPEGGRVAFIAVEPEDKARKSAKKKGYKQEIFEEDYRHRLVHVATIDLVPPAPADPADPPAEKDEPRVLPLEGSAWGLDWSADGSRLAVSLAPRPLIDDRYMLRKVHVVDAEDGTVHGVLEHSGKLGAFRLSPDGARVALIAGENEHDPKEGRLFVGAASGGPLTDLLPGLAGHVTTIAWADAKRVTYLADVGVESRLGVVGIDGTGTVRLESGPQAGIPLLKGLSLSRGGAAVLLGESPEHPRELFSLDPGADKPRRLTDSNPWLAAIELRPQEVVRHSSRDGVELEGILIRPERDGKAPLILIVHGGPEGHVSNGWVTSYSRPGQLAAGRGFAVFYPNYRGSTARGVAFSKMGQGDAAGREFDDLVDAVDHLIEAGIADRERVGVTGGSYGGYATAWCATKFTERFRAGVMFVGISNKLSKGMTTEIPNEDVLVHTGFDPWTRWEFSLERSPIYHAERSRTALLIAHGTADSRVHPSQSLQFYRALTGIGKTPVRYVRYPGEGHGNSKAAARDDYARRLIDWMEHFLIDDGTEVPPWDLGLGEDEDEEEEEEEEAEE